MKLRAGLTATLSDMKKLPLQPCTDLTRGLRLLPLSSSPQSVGDDDVTAEKEITETHFKSLLISFKVSTSKKVEMTHLVFQIKLWFTLLNLLSCTLFCLTFDFWTHIIHRKITGWGRLVHYPCSARTNLCLKKLQIKSPERWRLLGLALNEASGDVDSRWVEGGSRWWMN